MAEGRWSRDVVAALTGAKGADQKRLSGLLDGVEVQILTTVDPGDPAAKLLNQTLTLDRAFRLATRAAENEESIEKLRIRRGRGIATAEGLRVKDFERGSIRIQLDPSGRIRAALKSTGVLFLTTVCSLLGGGEVIAGILDGSTEIGELQHAPMISKAVLPLEDGDLRLETPARSEIRLLHKGEVVIIKLGPASDAR